MLIAALFVANPVCHIGLPDVDAWSVDRDALIDVARGSGDG